MAEGQYQDKKARRKRSSVTKTYAQVCSEIESMTGIPDQTIRDVFQAYAQVVRNHNLDGINVSLPFIGIIRLIKQYIPETYNKDIVKRYGAVSVPELHPDKKFTILFTPLVRISPAYRTMITDALPTNEKAHAIQKMPFQGEYKKFRFDRLTDADTENSDEDAVDELLKSEELAVDNDTIVLT